MPEKLLSKKELADLLGINPSTIDIYMTQGIPFIKLDPRKTGRVRFEYSKVLDWIRGRGGAKSE